MGNDLLGQAETLIALVTASPTTRPLLSQFEAAIECADRLIMEGYGASVIRVDDFIGRA